MKNSSLISRMFVTVGAMLLFAGVLSAQVATTTTLTSLPSSTSSLSQSVTLTASVTPGGATGNVTFMDGVAVLGVGTLNLNGTASFSTTSLLTGNRSLQAVYGGAVGYLTSRSAIVPHLVTALPTVGFAPAVNFGTGLAPYSITTGDFNGDQITDLAVANYGTNDVSILLGTGNGAFQTAVNYPVGFVPFSIAAGDFAGITARARVAAALRR